LTEEIDRAIIIYIDLINKNNMPTQKLPELGERRWGDTLNGYLSVSTDEKGGIYSFADTTARNTYFDNSTIHKTLSDGKTCIITSTGQIQKYDESVTTWNDTVKSTSQAVTDAIVYEKSVEPANDADLDPLYQGKQAKKVIFDDDSYCFKVVTDNYVETSQNGILKILGQDGTTILATLTKDKDTGAQSISYTTESETF